MNIAFLIIIMLFKQCDILCVDIASADTQFMATGICWMYFSVNLSSPRLLMCLHNTIIYSYSCM